MSELSKAEEKYQEAEEFLNKYIWNPSSELPKYIELLKQAYQEQKQKYEKEIKELIGLIEEKAIEECKMLAPAKRFKCKKCIYEIDNIMKDGYIFCTGFILNELLKSIKEKSK